VRNKAQPRDRLAFVCRSREDIDMRDGGNSDSRDERSSAPDASQPAHYDPTVPDWVQISHRPPLNPTVTALCWIVVFFYLVLALSYTFSGDRFLLLSDPARSVTVVGEVELILEEGLKNAPRWEQNFYRFIDRADPDLHSELLAEYQQVARYLEQNPDAGDEPWVSGLHSRIAYLRAEAGDWSDSEVLMPRSNPSEAEVAFATALSIAFASPTDSAGSHYGWEGALPNIDHSLLETSWTEESLGARLAERDGNHKESTLRTSRLEAAGASLLRRLRFADSAFIAILVSGIVVLLARTRWFTQSVNAARGLTVPPWSFQYGTSVLLRCAAGALVVAEIVHAISPGFTLVASIITGIPVILIANAYLCRPDKQRFTSLFGISMGEMSMGRLTFFALGLSAISLLGSISIHAVSTLFSADLPWQEFVFEPVLFGPEWKAALLTFDGVIGAPIMEEIAFRGILYLTLRARYKASISAVLSAGVFAFMHPYSVVGFLDVFWTGLVLAVGYEKCRSLYPCIFAHIVNNLLVFTTLWLVFR